MRSIVIDAGHGGTHRNGSRSTPIGVVSPTRGLREHEITLGLAKAVEQRLGAAAVLTRTTAHDNPSLGERVGVARRVNADVLISLHVNGGPGSSPGPQTWVHDHAGTDCARLGAQIQQRLMNLRGASGPSEVLRGPLAVLAPDRLGSRTAACLIEVDNLSDPDFEDWVADPSNVEAMGAAIAESIASFLRQRYGAGTLEGDESDDALYGFDDSAPDGIGDEDTASSLGWSQGLSADTDYPGATRFLSARTGHFRVPSKPRTIDRVVIHITDGTTLEGATSWAQSAQNTGKTSAHYYIGQNGEVVQMVRDANVAYHAHAANTRSIGIEHVAESPATAKKRNRATLAPTEAEYAASAALVNWLCDTYQIPEDREHIIGHSEADGATTHQDCPDSVWDWDYFMQLVTTRTCIPHTGYGQPNRSNSSGIVGRFESPHGDAERYGSALRETKTVGERAMLATAKRKSAPRSGNGRVGQLLVRPQELLQADISDARNLPDIARRILEMARRQASWIAGVTDLSYFPFSSICRLKLTYPNNVQYIGTGFYIGRETLLSCGHNFYKNHPTTGMPEAAQRVLVQPGYEPNVCRFDEKTFEINGADLVHPKWKAAVDEHRRSASDVLGWDLSVLHVPGLPAPTGEWFDLPDSCPAPQNFFVVGYGRMDGEGNEAPMRCDGGPITHDDGDVLRYAVNTEGGNSGSPVFLNDGSGMVIGVHTGGATPTENRGVCLTPEKNAWILSA
jgi:N-acetylmuramoyl-L-alanine amidase/V8-like Glu-specific endopeptidase/N-acetyl-anhydromuramyl-L-alanine amidase AmpD